MGLKMLWTTEAPARREAMTTTHDHASDGVPVGCVPPNLCLIVILSLSLSLNFYARGTEWTTKSLSLNLCVSGRDVIGSLEVDQPSWASFLVLDPKSLRRQWNPTLNQNYIYEAGLGQGKEYYWKKF